MEFTLIAPAKINLYLKVLHRRLDGFHSILSLMQMIDLCDTLTFCEDGTSVRLEVKQGNVPEDASNLVLKAARMLQKQIDPERRICKGVVITLDKKIPVSAGLGGGSSDAAATLRGLNALWSLRLSLPRLAEIGSFVGSDVPFFFKGPTAWVSGRGEQAKRVASPVSGYVVLVYSGEPVSTASVYHQMNAALLEDAECPTGRAIFPSDEAVRICPENDLEKVTLTLQPSLQKVKHLLVSFGGDAPLMSGSGPTIFARFNTRDHADAAVRAIKGEGYEHVWAAKLLQRVPNGFCVPRRSFSDSI